MRSTIALALLPLTLVVASGCPGPSAPDDTGVPRDAAARDAGGAGLDADLGEDARVAPGDGAPVEERDVGPTPCDRTRVDTSEPPESASWRFGGGVGYPDRPPSVGECVTVVATRAELETALAGASAGAVIFVRGDARIDLTGTSLRVPAGVTLASDRGLDASAGGLLFWTEIVNGSMLQIAGDDVRLSGLRLFGPDPTECPPEWNSPDHRDCPGDIAGDTNCRDCMPRPRGVAAIDADRLEVDNCELAGWSYGAIELARSHDDVVHHSEIHHNQRQGLGYGVVTSGIGNPADVEIHHNRFDYNRHSVAGSGAIGQSYEARRNLVLEHANGHVFDMHGISESASYVPATHGPEDVAGTRMRIHENVVLPTDNWALVVRGAPTEGAWFYDNCLARASGSAARQTRYTGRFHVDRSESGVAPNRYSQAPRDCLPARFCASAGGDGPWRYLARSSYGLGSLAFGDFDGDGRADVFRADDEGWWWLAGGTGAWTALNTLTTPLAQLAFGDFDGDGRTDAFRATGSAWEFSSGGASPWTRLQASSVPLASLAFGDFDGDGRTDVFRTTGSVWEFSRGGAAPFEQLNLSTFELGDLGFADLDGDGRTDVIRTNGTEWLVSSGGANRWATLNRSVVRLSSMRFADVDGDGRADVIHFTGSVWQVSYGGAGAWQPLAYRSDTDVVFHDLDGDGRADAFRTGCF